MVQPTPASLPLFLMAGFFIRFVFYPGLPVTNALNIKKSAQILPPSTSCARPIFSVGFLMLLPTNASKLGTAVVGNMALPPKPNARLANAQNSLITHVACINPTFAEN